MTKFSGEIENTYGCLSNPTLSEFVKVEEELFDSDSVSNDTGLELLHTIGIYVKDFTGVLLSRGMSALYN